MKQLETINLSFFLRLQQFTLIFAPHRLAEANQRAIYNRGDVYCLESFIKLTLKDPSSGFNSNVVMTVLKGYTYKENRGSE